MEPNYNDYETFRQALPVLKSEVSMRGSWPGEYVGNELATALINIDADITDVNLAEVVIYENNESTYMLLSSQQLVKHFGHYFNRDCYFTMPHLRMCLEKFILKNGKKYMYMEGDGEYTINRYILVDGPKEYHDYDEDLLNEYIKKHP